MWKLLRDMNSKITRTKKINENIQLVSKLLRQQSTKRAKAS